MRVLYRYYEELYVGVFNEVNFEEHTSFLILSSDDCDLKFKVPRSSALLIMSKLLLDGYCDLQAFDCDNY